MGGHSLQEHNATQEEVGDGGAEMRGTVTWGYMEICGGDMGQIWGLGHVVTLQHWRWLS